MGEFSLFHWLIVGAIVYFIYSRLQGGVGEPAAKKKSAKRNAFEDNVEWLRVRWADADRELASGSLTKFQNWYFDPVTDRQLARIEKEGLSASGVKLTKGKASDLIGLSEPVDDEHEVILKFFKVPVRGMNQSRGIYEVGRLLADPKNLEAWNSRPAEALQKEFFRFFGIKIPKDLTYVDADRLISEHSEKISEDSPPKLVEWESFESIVMDFSEKETRDDLDIKKPALSMLRAAIDALRKEGHSIEDLAGDLSLVAEKLLEMKPELEK